MRCFGDRTHCVSRSLYRAPYTCCADRLRGCRQRPFGEYLYDRYLRARRTRPLGACAIRRQGHSFVRRAVGRRTNECRNVYRVHGADAASLAPFRRACASRDEAHLWSVRRVTGTGTRGSGVSPPPRCHMWSRRDKTPCPAPAGGTSGAARAGQRGGSSSPDELVRALLGSGAYACTARCRCATGAKSVVANRDNAGTVAPGQVESSEHVRVILAPHPFTPCGDKVVLSALMRRVICSRGTHAVDSLC